MTQRIEYKEASPEAFKAMLGLEKRLHLLAAWREAPCYSDLKRAGLAWARGGVSNPSWKLRRRRSRAQVADSDPDEASAA
jgi:hypothetical protein